MLFNSLSFVLFFPIVIVLYFVTPNKYRWLLLLLASYYFYMSWNPSYIILIGITTLVSYYTAIKIGASEKKKTKKIMMITSLVINLGILFVFKYFNFFNESLRTTFDFLGLYYNVPYLEFLLPVGISFYTFQTLSYTVDVYHGKTPVEKHLGIFALYVSFFPQLVAGPIERSSHLLPQFWKKHAFSYPKLASGLRLMTWGFFKKIVVADRLSLFVNAVYNNQEMHSGSTLILATFFFAIQIYCDFSGYSDIAIGAARIMGYDLMKNFKRPYFSKSIQEFWHRWHVSLSTWFRDYVYIPLGGNRVSKNRWYFNLFITFVVSGLWHGANWTFVAWGALHGFYLIFANWTNSLKNIYRKYIVKNKAINSFYQAGQILITFILANFAWVFFRANDIQGALEILNKMVHPFEGDIYISSWTLILNSFFVTFVLLFVELVIEYGNKWRTIYNTNWIIQTSFVSVTLVLIILFGVFDGGQFIYFQF